ncbi:MAG: YggT family protein [Vulcanibacillus sp.]
MDNLQYLISIFFEIYSWLIIAYILMSWLPQMKESQIGVIIGKVVEPYLNPFKKIIPAIGMIDISPIVALFALVFIENGIHVVINFFR